MCPSTIAHRLTERIAINLEGKEWPLLFTHDVLLDIEEVSGLSILRGELSMGRPSAKGLRAVLYVALKHSGAACSLEAAGTLLGSMQCMEIRNAIIRAWIAAMPEHDPTEGKGGGHIENWMEGWAIARQDLGLSTDEWLAMTPRMLQELSRKRLEGIREQEFMQSKAIAWNAYYGARGPKELPEEDRWMIHPWKQKEQEPERINDVYIRKLFRSKAS